MPLLQELFNRASRAPPGQTVRNVQHSETPAGVSLVQSQRDTAETVETQRQEISAFLPLSRWMARVQGPGSGTSDA